MKKQIKIFAGFLIGNIFFAGFFMTTFAQENTNEKDLYESLVQQKCEAIANKEQGFRQTKLEKGFDYKKNAYQKSAYESELKAYINLEKALSCLDEKKECRKNLEKNLEGKVNINSGKCIDKDNNEISDDIEKLKIADYFFVKSANFFEESINKYRGSKYFKLEDENKFDDEGNPVQSEDGLDTILTKNIVMQLGGGFIGNTQNTLQQIFRGNLIRKVNRALGTLAILYLFILGVKFILARGKSERLSDLKEQFGWIILGLGIISLAEFIGYEVFNPADGNDVLEGVSAQNFRSIVMEVVRFFEYIAGGLMLINALITGYGLIMGGEEDETISKEKQFLKSFLMGTAFILLAEVIVRALSFENIHESSQIIIKEVAGLVNFSLSFIGIVATAMLVLSGLYYVISFGDDDQMKRAKKMIISSIIGIIIAFSAYTIVRFLIV